MTAHATVQMASEEALAPAHPQVFVRAFTVPPGAPWEQSRAAGLDARHGAPLPVAELMMRVKRLVAWRVGAPGRYAAFYIRSREFEAAFETVVEVDGRPHTVSFGTSADQAERLQRLAIIGGAALAASFLLMMAVSLGSASKAERETRLEALELQAQQRLRTARAYARQKEVAQELEGAVGQAAQLDQVLTELSWVARFKASEARLLAIHWDKGLLAVESRGEGSPFLNPDRFVERLEKPVRPGVWLWGVGPRGSAEVRKGAKP